MATEVTQEPASEQRKPLSAVGETRIEPSRPAWREYELQAAAAPGTFAHRHVMLWERH